MYIANNKTEKKRSRCYRHLLLFFFIDKFLKKCQITIDFIHLMRYNYKYKGGEKVGKKQNKKEDSKQETLLKLSIILALVQLIKTIIELIAKIF